MMRSYSLPPPRLLVALLLALSAAACSDLIPPTAPDTDFSPA